MKIEIIERKLPYSYRNGLTYGLRRNRWPFRQWWDFKDNRWEFRNSQPTHSWFWRGYEQVEAMRDNMLASYKRDVLEAHGLDKVTNKEEKNGKLIIAVQGEFVPWYIDPEKKGFYLLKFTKPVETWYEYREWDGNWRWDKHGDFFHFRKWYKPE